MSEKGTILLKYKNEFKIYSSDEYEIILNNKSYKNICLFGDLHRRFYEFLINEHLINHDLKEVNCEFYIELFQDINTASIEINYFNNDINERFEIMLPSFLFKIVE